MEILNTEVTRRKNENTFASDFEVHRVPIAIGSSDALNWKDKASPLNKHSTGDTALPKATLRSQSPRIGAFTFLCAFAVNAAGWKINNYDSLSLRSQIVTLEVP